MSMRHVILFEPDASGHRMVFIRYIVEAMARHGGVRATLVTSRRVATTGWVAAMRDQLDRYLSFHVADDAEVGARRRWLPSKLARQVDHSRHLTDAVRNLRRRGAVDRVFIPFIDDYCLFPFAVQRRPFADLPWGGIAIRPRFHLARMGAQVPWRWEDRVEALAYRGLLRGRSLDTLFSIDPCFAPSVGDLRVRSICDPADIATQAVDRGWLPVPACRIVLLVYGHIDHRKAIDRLLGVAADPRMPAALTVALVGEQDPAMAPVLDGAAARALRAEGRLVEVARRVDDAEEAAAFARADIVWGYYPGNYCSSGAMVRAGRAGRPLMATGEGLVGLLTRQRGSGLVAPEADDGALLRTVSQLVLDAGLRRTLGDAGKRHFGGDTGMAFGDRIVGHFTGALA